MKKQIASISIIQSSKILTALYFLMGFLYSFAGVLMIIFGPRPLKIVGIVYLFGPIWMAIIGFVFFVICAAVYNLLASLLGGIEFEVKDAGQ